MGEMSRTLLVLCCCAAHIALSSASPRPPSLAELETSASGTVGGGMSVDEDLARNSTASDFESALRQEASNDTVTIDTPGQISNPTYPAPLQKASTLKAKIVAPEGLRVKLVMEDFDLFDPFVAPCIDYLIIYFTGDDDGEKLTACGTQISKGTEFFSVGNTLLLDFFNVDYHPAIVSPHRGFLATVSFGPFDNGGSVGDSAGREGTLTVLGQKGECSLAPTATNGTNVTYLLQSPQYPELYGWCAECIYKISTASPSFLRVTALDVQLGLFDFLGAKLKFHDHHNYNFRKRDAAVVVPTSHVTLEFHSFIFTWGKFNLQVEALASNCHEVIQVEAGVVGELILPSTYSADTICEWWLVAAEGEEIALEIQEDFHIGADKNMHFCKQDYLLIQIDGDRHYEYDSEKLCGSNSPKIFYSRRNAMNVLFNGIKGGTNYFPAHYYLT